MLELNDEKVKALELKANEIRIAIIEMLVAAGSGHTAGPLGMADIFTALYFAGDEVMRHDPKRPEWQERDRVVLSNGHICPVLYATMAYAGYFPVEELKTLRKFGSRLQGHPHREWLPMLETSSGPLGSGPSQATGMALALRMEQKASQAQVDPAATRVQAARQFVYCLVSDGEHDCGNFWEGAMLAGKNKLGNLIVIVDRNNIQIDGNTEDIMPLEPLADKWRAWNFHVQEIDGHDFRQIVGAIAQAKAVTDKPSVIIARTIPGKGVSFMEGRYEWHGTPPGISDISGAPPKAEQAEAALRELRAIGERVRG